MGLDTSHDCWHGAYSAFMRWRVEIANAAGLPPLELMEGFFNPAEVLGNPFYFIRGLQEHERTSMTRVVERLPISWDCLKPDPLYILLHHSDCDGSIASKDCGPIAGSLETLLPRLNGNGGGHIGNYREKTQQFINGLRKAAANEAVDFH